MTWSTMRSLWIAAMSITIISSIAAWWQWYQYRSLVQELSYLHMMYQAFPEMLWPEYDRNIEEDDDTSSFIVINRDSAYLSTQAQAFIQQGLSQRMRSFIRQERNSKKPYHYQHYQQSSRNSPRLAMPLQQGHFWISSLFGPRKQPSGKYGYHYGVDFAATRGTPVYASADGVVTQAGWHGGYGNVVVISHNDGCKTRYAHLHNIYVRYQDRVSCGARIGEVGDTGNVRKTGRDASHLHLEVEVNGKKRNPLHYLKIGRV